MKDVTLPVGLLELNENELLYLLGEELSTPEPRSVLALDGMEGAIASARAWLGEHREELRNRLCGHPVVTATLSEASLHHQRAILLLTIADVIAGAKWNIPPFVVSALLIRQGLAELCR